MNCSAVPRLQAIAPPSLPADRTRYPFIFLPQHRQRFAGMPSICSATPLQSEPMEENSNSCTTLGEPEITRLGRRLQHLRKAIGRDLPGRHKGNFAFDDRFGLLKDQPK